MKIAVVGVPGTGKTAFSKCISDALGLYYVSLNDIVIKNKLYAKYDRDRECYVIDVKKAMAFLIRYLDELKDNYIIEGHAVLDVVPCSYIDKCVVLRCNPYELWARLEERGYSRSKIMENVQAEILDIIYAEALRRCGREKVIQLDVTENVISACRKFLDSLLKGAPLKSDHVDWLTYIEGKGDLKKFFP